MWLFVLLTAGLGLLYLGAKQVWFIGVLGAENCPVERYHLAWMLFGAAYSVLPTFAWAWLSRTPTKWRVLMAFLVTLVPMLAASHVTAISARARLSLVVAGVRWDSDHRGFVVELAAPPGVIRACKSGTLQPWAKIEGLAGRIPFRLGDAPRLFQGVHIAWQGGLYVRGGPLPVYYSDLNSLGTIIVPWQGEPESSSVIWISKIDAGLKNRNGDGVGGWSQARFQAGFFVP